MQILQLLLNLLVCGAWCSKLHVLPNRRLKDEWVLANVANLLAKAVNLKLLDVLAVNHDVAKLWIVVTLNQMDQRRLSALVTIDGRGLVRLEGVREIVNDVLLFVGWVGK